MDYIGSKKNLLTFLEQNILNVISTNNLSLQDIIFCDLFSGTGSVARHFKKLIGNKGKGSVIANDLQFYSYVLNKHYLENNSNSKIDFDKVEEINALPLIDTGFIFNNYSSKSGRLYFSEHNAKFCDTARLQIEKWFINEDINASTYFFLLASLLESLDKVSNTTSVYAAFLKQLQKSAMKKIEISPLPIEDGCKGKVFQENASTLIDKISGDVLYLDPPYNARHYCDNYHLLETITRYDNPEIKGTTGLRADNVHFKSAFSRKREAKDALEAIIQKANFKFIFLSYNNEGIISSDEIKEIMQKFGNYHCFEQSHKRFKSHSKGEQINNVTEFLHFVEKR